MLEFIQANQTIILLVASSSVAFFLIALVIIPLVAVRIPAEYFAGKKRPLPFTRRLKNLIKSKPSLIIY